VELAGVNLLDLDQFVDGVPHELFASLRGRDPYWQDEPGGPGFWNFTRYDDVVRINKDNQTFSSHRGTALMTEMPPDQLEQQRMMMLNMDPPMHTRYRLLVNKGFTPRMVGQLEDNIRERTRAIIETTRGSGEFDFVNDIAAELPCRSSPT
jgi:cholest-4-en-3-one 26-monooxygenase